MAAESFDSMIAGMVSRPVEARDQAYVAELRLALTAPDLRRRLGDRLPAVETLVEALARRG